VTEHKHPDERAAEILAAARTCFLEKGYFATKMDAIARESGLSKGGIYFHFSSKREIFRALVQQEYDVTMSFIDSVVEHETDITVKLIELAEHFMKLFASSDRPRFMVIIGEMALRDEEIADMLRDLQLNYFERISQILDAGIQAGQLREVDVRSCSIVLKALIDGVQANFAVGVDLDLEAVVAAGLDLLTQGLVAN
jgi:AcrR family transcriptional regulator